MLVLLYDFCRLLGNNSITSEGGREDKKRL